MMILCLSFLRRAAGLVLLAGAATSAVACGDDDPPRKRFIAAYCDALDECCVADGEENSPSACRQFYGLFTADANFDEARGDECLRQIEAAGPQAACGGKPAVTAACEDVFTEKKGSGGDVQPGQPCESSSDCATVPGATDVYCGGTSSASICTAMVTRGAGESCENTAGYFVTCDEASETYCDYSTKLCTASLGEGEVCDSGGNCRRDLYCQAGGLDQPYVCAKRPGEGQPCQGNNCAPGLFCGAGEACVPRLADGQPCSSYDSCQSGNCSDSVCQAAGSSSFSLCFTRD